MELLRLCNTFVRSWKEDRYLFVSIQIKELDKIIKLLPGVLKANSELAIKTLRLYSILQKNMILKLWVSISISDPIWRKRISKYLFKQLNWYLKTVKFFQTWNLSMWVEELESNTLLNNSWWTLRSYIEK